MERNALGLSFFSGCAVAIVKMVVVEKARAGKLIWGGFARELLVTFFCAP